MTKGDLKEKLSDHTFFQGIMNIAKDTTLGDSRKDQLEGLIFLHLTGEYWDSCDDNSDI